MKPYEEIRLTGPKKTALLLIAHGSRRREANADLDYLADQFRKLGQYHDIQTAYLELTEPSIPDAGNRCATSGAERVILVPYFLSPGVHVRDDLTEAKAEMEAKFPNVEFFLAEPLGQHPLLLEVIRQRIDEITYTTN
jgi:sirohydrochlorin ferrochelatase